MNITQLDTPSAIVDLDILKANIHRLQRYLDKHGIENWPHIKTHKIPAIAKMQMEAGAAGITCQKLGEAEIMVEAGIRDIFLPYNLLGEAKLTRLTRLLPRANLRMTADSAFVVMGLSGAAKNAGVELSVLVEFDGGMKRCGVQTPSQAAALAQVIHHSPFLKFGGLMTYPTNEKTGPFVRETKALLANDGLEIQRVSGGSTAGMWRVHEHPEITEHRAGMYVFGDRYTMASGAVKPEDVAYTVLATVVSRPTETRGILDAGSKTLSSDLLNLQGYGHILEYPEAEIFGLSEEHGHTDFSKCARKPEIGERVTVVVNHCCVSVNLFNELIGVRNGEVEVVWEVAARGALQ